MRMDKFDLNIAEAWAIDKHNAVNQKYGGYLPYTYHLELVAAIGRQYIDLLPPSKNKNLAIAVCYLHDVLEDCHVTYNDLKEQFGVEVAETVYALTNEKGRTRKERANGRYYQGLRENFVARYVKVCDRLANSLYSCMFGSSMFEMYKKEYKSFKEELYCDDLKLMFEALENLYNHKTFGFEPLSRVLIPTL